MPFFGGVHPAPGPPRQLPPLETSTCGVIWRWGKKDGCRRSPHIGGPHPVLYGVYSVFLSVKSCVFVGGLLASQYPVCSPFATRRPMPNRGTATPPIGKVSGAHRSPEPAGMGPSHPKMGILGGLWPLGKHRFQLRNGAAHPARTQGHQPTGRVASDISTLPLIRPLAPTARVPVSRDGEVGAQRSYYLLHGAL